MATAELGDWHTGRILITKDSAELIVFEQAAEDNELPGQLRLASLEAILALRDLIDEEVQRAEQRAELAETPSNVNGVLTSGNVANTI